MSVEERVGRSLEDTLAGIDPGVGDVADAVNRGRQVRRRRRVGAGLVTAALLAGAVVGGTALRGADDTPEPAPPAGGTWHELAPMPLSPRWSPLAVWTGSEVVVLGGGIDPPCPPNADCTDPDPMARDGAAYDPDTDTWRPIADAPVEVGYWYRSAYVAGEVVVRGEDRWWAYDPDGDSWHELPTPPRPLVDTGDLATSDDGFVYALSRSGRLWALNVAEERWAEVPQGSPDGFERRTVVVTDAISFSGVRADDPDGHVVVDLGHGGGPLLETGQVGPFRHWTGRRLVELDLQVTQDGTPYGGRLDPATGEWSPLPDAPSVEADRGDGWSVVAADGPLLAGWGYAYDDDTGRWTTLGRPDTEVDDSQAAVWADGRLLVFGGLDTETGYEALSGLSNEAWAWSPAP